MLLEISLRQAYPMCCAYQSKIYQFTLAAGTYYFQRIPHPVLDNGPDWLALTQAPLIFAQLPPEAIIGLNYEYFEFLSLAKYPFPSLYLEVTNIVADAEPLLALTETVAPIIKRAAMIIPIKPKSTHPRYIRTHPKNHAHIIALRKQTSGQIYLPAARRVCS